MRYRVAHPADIPALAEVRFAVRENVLRNRALVTEADYLAYLTQRGQGWLAEVEGRVVGFAIADAQEHSVWALFVHPDFDQQGIGKALLQLLLSWYFAQTDHAIWLSTAPGTRAEGFYRRQGWQETGRTGSGEIRFELTKERWENIARQ